jgi:hypothetical protein
MVRHVGYGRTASEAYNNARTNEAAYNIASAVGNSDAGQFVGGLVILLGILAAIGAVLHHAWLWVVSQPFIVLGAEVVVGGLIVFFVVRRLARFTRRCRMTPAQREFSDAIEAVSKDIRG